MSDTRVREHRRNPAAATQKYRSQQARLFLQSDSPTWVLDSTARYGFVCSRLTAASIAADGDALPIRSPCLRLGQNREIQYRFGRGSRTSNTAASLATNCRSSGGQLDRQSAKCLESDWLGCAARRKKARAPQPRGSFSKTGRS